MIEETLKNYKDKALDFNQPLFLEIYHLHKLYPNDTEFGSKVRELINRIEDHHRQYLKDSNIKNLTELLNNINTNI